MNKITKYDACVIKTDGSVTEIKPRNGTDFTLEEMQEVVGGYIEVVRSMEMDRIMVVNEEGKLKKLPFNPKATAFYPALSDIIVGDVLVCKRGMIK